VALLAHASARFAASPSRLDEARALVDLGGAMRRANQRAEARRPLRRALALARECGARALAEEARQELLVTGVRVPRDDASGVDGLTPSETRITQMAAESMSNPEIAQALFVTVKTVEMHLGNAYRKLGVRSRRELPRALATPSRAGEEAEQPL
jgi:DNA-binding CsgD family transcriptional regulator